MDQHVFEKLYAYREALKQINWQNVSPKIASANDVLRLPFFMRSNKVRNNEKETLPYT